MRPRCIVIHTSVASEEDALALAREAVEARLAACVQILGPGRSVYRWKGAIEEEPEYYLVFKTSAKQREALLDWLAKRHSYDVPEIVWMECATSSDYGEWLRRETEMHDDE